MTWHFEIDEVFKGIVGLTDDDLSTLRENEIIQ